MNMPDIEDLTESQQEWFKPEEVIPSIIAEIGELNESEIKRVVDELKRPYFLSPKVLTLEHDDVYTMAYRDYITLQGNQVPVERMGGGIRESEVSLRQKTPTNPDFLLI